MDSFLQGRNIPKERLDSLVEQARDYAVTNGILMIPKDASSPNVFSQAPFTLFASPFPKTLFKQGFDVQEDFNILVDKVSKDFEFLQASLASAMEADVFTKKLFDIHKITREEGIAQKLSLGLLRSDYMMNPISEDTKDFVHGYEIKQIEINTIASSFAGIGSRVTGLHRYVQETYGDVDATIAEKLPTNHAAKGLGEVIVKAWNLFGNKSAIVVIIVQQGENNRVDQRVIEYTIRDSNPAVKVVRRTLKQVEENGSLQEDKTLVIDGKEIAVAYFRAGYTPNDYYSDKEWSGRLKLERSRAIKCPTVAYQLVGTKKIQQVLAEPGNVERFLEDPESVARIRKTFAGLFTLDNGDEGDKNVKMAIENPQRFVVKPQREGGGNNVYGEAIREVLSKNDDSRTQYVLMEKIRPPILKNYIVQVHKDEVLEEDVVCEYGVFGVVISDENGIVENKTVGHLLRTKSTIHDDGGVAALRAVLDSPCLV
ncbi:glutathione synthetase-like [Dendronephthya gigantea]|uniref:glutathione synthetase-like n=1 Tax=Dendronephthya gigantea TaxID=151771 RepID=UPI0010694BCB|nr:glutathione synthetase-like [Dendronephthya gigantea]